MKRFGIVMAGGSGERFWPVSTPGRPKQLLDLTGSGKSLLEEAIERIAPVVDEVFVSTSAPLGEIIARSGLVQPDRVLAEPARRNTAGALVWCMAQLAKRTTGPFAAAIVTADHVIRPEAAFHGDVRTAFRLAEEEGALSIIGIPPTRPETGFGYVEWEGSHGVKRFREKPDLATATAFLECGNFLWNSGMFFWRSDVFAAEMTRVAPDVGSILEDLPGLDGEGATARFLELPNQSIDYLLMEHASKVMGVRASFIWDDVGTWDALLRTVPLDPAGNAVVGNVRLIDCAGCVAYNAGGHPLTLVGCRNIIHVATPDASLVCPMDRAQDVREAARLGD